MTVVLQLLIALTAVWPAVDRSSATSVAQGFFPIESKARITDVTTVGRFGVASFQHGHIEGASVSGQLLLQKFGFGWQVVDLSRGDSRFTTSDIMSHGLSSAEARKLLRGFVPGSTRLNACNPTCIWDYGSTNDIEAVRKLMLQDQGEAIGPVRIDNDWAMLEWWSRGGGEALFAKRGDHWEKISGGGGCMSMGDLLNYGVPSSAAQRFEYWIPCGVQCGRYNRVAARQSASFSW
jgi:hypothetical protein